MAVTIKSRDVVNFNAIATDKGPKKDQYLDFVDDAGETVATLAVPASGESPSFEVPSGTNVQTVYSTSVTLTDAQIKALPDTDVDLVGAPGAGKLLQYKGAVWDISPSGGAYTNEDAFEIATKIGDYGVAAGYIESAQGYFGGDTRTFLDIPPNYDSGGGFGIAGFADETSINQPIKLTASNAAAGSLTGGHADNYLDVTVFYSIIDVQS